jgi:hypothetical protein
MAVVSGKDGNVKVGATTIAHVTKWSFSPESNNPNWASNQTAGYKNRVAGIKDGKGKLSCKWDTTALQIATIDVGQAITLDLFTTATQKYVVPAIIDDLEVTVDLDKGETEDLDIKFSITGAWTNPT